MFSFENRSNIYFNESLSYDTSRLMKTVRDKTRAYNNTLRSDKHEKKIVVRTERGVIKIRVPGSPGSSKRFIKILAVEDLPDK